MALNPLVSLFGRLVARSGRKHGNRQTDRRTDLQTKYCNPRCACAPRVNEVKGTRETEEAGRGGVEEDQEGTEEDREGTEEG